ncbi:hypothetical protein Pelo_8464 [Pelomyxa schiedti]|nr:hypothetical protein Pelo_8464 [Pelomyxa schiedti]
MKLEQPSPITVSSSTSTVSASPAVEPTNFVFPSAPSFEFSAPLSVPSGSPEFESAAPAVTPPAAYPTHGKHSRRNRSKPAKAAAKEWQRVAAKTTPPKSFNFLQDVSNKHWDFLGNLSCAEFVVLLKKAYKEKRLSASDTSDNFECTVKSRRHSSSKSSSHNFYHKDKFYLSGQANFAKQEPLSPAPVVACPVEDAVTVPNPPTPRLHPLPEEPTLPSLDISATLEQVSSLGNSPTPVHNAVSPLAPSLHIEPSVEFQLVSPLMSASCPTFVPPVQSVSNPPAIHPSPSVSPGCPTPVPSPASPLSQGCIPASHQTIPLLRGGIAVYDPHITIAPIFGGSFLTACDPLSQYAYQPTVSDQHDRTLSYLLDENSSQVLPFDSYVEDLTAPFPCPVFQPPFSHVESLYSALYESVQEAKNYSLPANQNSGSQAVSDSLMSTLLYIKCAAYSARDNGMVPEWELSKFDQLLDCVIQIERALLANNVMFVLQLELPTHLG